MKLHSKISTEEKERRKNINANRKRADSLSLSYYTIIWSIDGLKKKYLN